MTDTPKTYRLLKSDLAAKLSTRSQGGITYILLADLSDWPDLHIAVTANEGGGLWGKEAVALSTIETIIDGFNGAPFPTKALREATVGRSSNNAPFCLAVLKDLGLAQSSSDKRHHYVKAGDWDAFRDEWLMHEGHEVAYPEPLPDQSGETNSSDAGEASNDPSPAQPEAVIPPKAQKRKKPAKPDQEPVAATGLEDAGDEATE